jgi:hypothetical protein
MYSINFRQLFKTITPAFLRRNALLSFLYSFAKPLQTLNTTVIVPWRARVRSLVVFDGRTLMMEKLLNDQYLLTYDPNQRENDISLSSIIYIDNVANNNLFYLYNKSEGRDPVYLYNKSELQAPVYLFNLSEAGSYPVFIVYVPNLLGGTYETANTNDNLKLRQFVERFRLAGRTNYLIFRY